MNRTHSKMRHIYGMSWLLYWTGFGWGGAAVIAVMIACAIAAL